MKKRREMLIMKIKNFTRAMIQYVKIENVEW